MGTAEAATAADAPSAPKEDSQIIHEMMNDMIERVSRVSMSEIDPLADQNATDPPKSPEVVADCLPQSGVEHAIQLGLDVAHRSHGMLHLSNSDQPGSLPILLLQEESSLSVKES